MKQYPIPEDLLQSHEFLGLTTEQLLISMSAPGFVLGLSLMFDDIVPPIGALVLTGITLVGLFLIVIRAPEGQDPFKWFAAQIETLGHPDRYTVGPPTARENREILNLDVIHTRDNPGEYSPAVREYLDNGTPVVETEGVISLDEVDGQSRVANPSTANLRLNANSGER